MKLSLSGPGNRLEWMSIRANLVGIGSSNEKIVFDTVSVFPTVHARGDKLCELLRGLIT